MNAPIPALLATFWLILASAASVSAAPLGTAFTWQGQLTDNGAPASGAYDFTVFLHVAADSQTPLGMVTAPGVTVTAGVFTLSLDFGAAAFDGSARWIEISVLKSGESGAAAVLAPRQEVSPTPYALMAKNVPNGSVTAAKLAAGAVGSTQLAAGSISPDKLAPGAAAANLAASGQSAVASGGVVLSPLPHAPDLVSAGYFQVGKTDLIQEQWMPWVSSQDAPTPVSSYAKAIWTGTEYLVWGGGTNAGARFNPVTSVWTAMSQVNAPAARDSHSAVWTGTEMLVWGGWGNGSLLMSGGRYNPLTNTWQAMSTVNAPAGREDAPAVWTGTEMLVWGGGSIHTELNTGGRYNPATNTWQAIATTNAPAARYGHAAVWTGSRMIVCGGARDNLWHDEEYEEALTTAGSYNPANNTWTTMPDGPEAIYAAAVWTGGAMIVTGGYNYHLWIEYDSYFEPLFYHTDKMDSGTGIAYNPGTTLWTQVTDNSALNRAEHSAVWTGTEMIVWGGSTANDQSYWGLLNDGARYNPATGVWTSLPAAGAPSGRRGHSASWTGSRMLIWGGGQPDGGRYDPATNAWSPMTGLTERSARSGATCVWTGSEFIVWGGVDDYGAIIQYGQKFSPVTGLWTMATSQGAPTARHGHTAVWTGSRMIIWGGRNHQGSLNDGAAYDPATNSWTRVTSRSAPVARDGHRAVWTGSEMLAWGGSSVADIPLQSGGLYNPVSDSWSRVSPAGAPAGRFHFGLVWTGHEAVLWGGDFRGSQPVSGGRYDPVSDTWLPTTLTNVPPGRSAPAAVWTGHEAIFWGGGDAADGYPSVHGKYDPATDTWTTMPTAAAPTPRAGHCGVWDGRRMIVWGGEANGVFTSTGSMYSPDTNQWREITNGLQYTPGAHSGHLSVWAGTSLLIWGGRGPTGLLKDTYTYTPPGTFYLYLRP